MRLEPWLSVADVGVGIAWYADAFGATVTYRLDDDEGHPMVATIAVEDVAFWLQEGTTGPGAASRTLLVVHDPDAFFERAVAAGAEAISPVGDEHGWRAGRCADPFGHHWDIARELSG